jgi:hypothetical protein
LNFGHSCLPAGRGAYLLFGAWNLVLLIICSMLSGLIDGWERNDKFCSDMDLALHLYLSPILLHNIFRDG